MEQTIEAKTVLLAADKIRSLGVPKNHQYVYHQISLEVSYDGYTLILSDRLVTLTLFFHNKIKVDYQRLADLEKFYSTLKQIANEDA